MRNYCFLTTLHKRQKKIVLICVEHECNFSSWQIELCWFFSSLSEKIAELAKLQQDLEMEQSAASVLKTTVENQLVQNKELLEQLDAQKQKNNVRILQIPLLFLPLLSPHHIFSHWEQVLFYGHCGRRQTQFSRQIVTFAIQPIMIS